jgi:hypothetical protein
LQAPLLFATALCAALAAVASASPGFVRGLGPDFGSDFNTTPRELQAGGVPAGGVCDATHSCASGTVCFLATFAYPGRCYPVGLGPGDSDACSYPTGGHNDDEGPLPGTDICRRGICGCDVDSAFVCTDVYGCVMIPGGGTCGSNTECASNVCTAGTCDESLTPVGFPCSLAGECSTATCTGGVCALRGAGAACSAGSNCLSGVCTGGACRALPSATRTPTRSPTQSKTRPAKSSRSPTRTYTPRPTVSYSPRPTRHVNAGCGHGGRCYTNSPSPSRNKNLPPASRKGGK